MWAMTDSINGHRDVRVPTSCASRRIGDTIYGSDQRVASNTSENLDLTMRVSTRALREAGARFRMMSRNRSVLYTNGNDTQRR